jgi:hypothetical protein
VAHLASAHGGRAPVAQLSPLPLPAAQPLSFPPCGPRKPPPSTWAVRLARGPAAPMARPLLPPAHALGSCPATAAPRWGPPVSLRGVAPCSSSLSHERAFFSFPRANRSPDASLFPHRPATGEPPPLHLATPPSLLEVSPSRSPFPRPFPLRSRPRRDTHLPWPACARPARSAARPAWCARPWSRRRRPFARPAARPAQPARVRGLGAARGQGVRRCPGVASASRPATLTRPSPSHPPPARANPPSSTASARSAARALAVACSRSAPARPSPHPVPAARGLELGRRASGARPELGWRGRGDPRSLPAMARRGASDPAQRASMALGARRGPCAVWGAPWRPSSPAARLWQPARLARGGLRSAWQPVRGVLAAAARSRAQQRPAASASSLARPVCLCAQLGMARLG